MIHLNHSTVELNAIRHYDNCISSLSSHRISNKNVFKFEIHRALMRGLLCVALPHTQLHPLTVAQMRIENGFLLFPFSAFSICFGSLFGHLHDPFPFISLSVG